MKVLIGYDGSPSADAALLDLRRAGLPDDTEALVVSVADVMMAPAQSGFEIVEQTSSSPRVSAGIMLAQKQSARVLLEAKAFTTKASERLRSYFPKWDVSAEEPAGQPFWELVKKADEWRPDLVVVGSHGHSLAGRLILGSISRKIVTDSYHSVRVARGRLSGDDFIPLRLIIGVNGSPEAEQAVRAVGRRVWPDGTEVRIITVDEGTSPIKLAQFIPSGAAMIHDENEESTRAARKMVEWAENELRVIGLNVSVAIENGDAETVLIHQAQEWHADAIFVGGRRFRSAFERFRLGSVATRLVTKAPSSVEVVRSFD
jgi:nucleotide-binding universal stress UspA family protein